AFVFIIDILLVNVICKVDYPAPFFTDLAVGKTRFRPETALSSSQRSKCGYPPFFPRLISLSVPSSRILLSRRPFTCRSDTAKLRCTCTKFDLGNRISIFEKPTFTSKYSSCPTHSHVLSSFAST